MDKIIIYHGSDHIIKNPKYGMGKIHNDYGLGFYCTEYIDLAKEWACSKDSGGFANKYELDCRGLKVLDLNSDEYCVVHWISVLLKNRIFTIDSELAIQAQKYILKNFAVNTEDVDVIKGYRADDSYFSFAKDFLQNTISVSRLTQVMKLGNLGNQIVLISKKAFSQINFISAEESEQSIYYPLKEKRDLLAREAYLGNKQGDAFAKDQIYILDIIRNEIKADDPRLQ